MEKPITTQKSPLIMEMHPGTYYYCSCGKSSKQPFCDGSHQGSSLVPKKLKLLKLKKWHGVLASIRQMHHFAMGHMQNYKKNVY